MKIFTINKKVNWPLLAALLGATVGALSGQFAWALIAAAGLWAMASIAQNLTAIFQRTVSAEGQTTQMQSDVAISSSIEKSPDWLQEWEEEMHYSPAYKGTPGNIWNGPKWSSGD